MASAKWSLLIWNILYISSIRSSDGFDLRKQKKQNLSVSKFKNMHSTLSISSYNEKSFFTIQLTSNVLNEEGF